MKAYPGWVCIIRKEGGIKTKPPKNKSLSTINEEDAKEGN